MKKLAHRNCSQKTELTPMQRLNMHNMGLNVDSHTTEKECLKVLRKQKFPEFSVKVTA